MREKLQTLPLAELKELAKSQGLKGISTLRKAEIIELLCRENEAAAQSEAVLQPDSGSSEGREAQSSREPQSSKENGEPRDSEKSRDSGKPRDGRPQRDSSRQTRFVRQPRTSYGQQNSKRSFQGFSRKQGAKGEPGIQRQQGVKESRESRETGDIRDTRETRADVRESRPEPRSDASGIAGQDMAELDSGIEANGILEVMPDGFGFIRCENFLPGENDVYVAPSQIRRFNLKTGDIIVGNRRIKAVTEKFAALLYIKTVNGYPFKRHRTPPEF